MRLLMISGDRSILQRRQGAFWYTLQELRKHWDRIDIICPRVPRPSRNGEHRMLAGESSLVGGSVFFHPCPWRLFCQPIWIIRRGRALVREYHHEVMTVHEYPPFYNGFGARFLAWHLHLPYALEVHHLVGFPRPASLREGIGRFLSRIYLPFDARGAKAVRAVNKNVKRQLVAWGIPEKKVHVVPSFYLNGYVVETETRPPVVYDVSFCARLVPSKGLKVLQ